MKFIFSILFIVSSQAFAAFCDSSIASQVTVRDGAPLVMEYTTGNYKFTVGHQLEIFPAAIDKEAFKRAVMYCAPKFSECLKKSSLLEKTSVMQFVVGLHSSSPETARSVRIQTAGKEEVPAELGSCITKIANRIEFPQVKNNYKMTIPVKVEIVK